MNEDNTQKTNIIHIGSKTALKNTVPFFTPADKMESDKKN